MKRSPMMRKSERLDGGSPAAPRAADEPPDEFVWSFVESMPSHYGGYEPATIRAHAAIVYQRRGAGVRVGTWRRLPGGGVAICVVAPDRPGLLSLVAAALTSHDLDIIAAQIYTRTASKKKEQEAVDLFWLRRRPKAHGPPEITNEEIDRLESLLRDLLKGDGVARRRVERTAVDAPCAAPGMTIVRFEPGHDGASVLVVQTLDRPGLLLTISRCLFCLDVQVVESDVSTAQGRVLDRFYLVEFDGSAISESRRGQIEMEVLAAVESLGRLLS